MLQWGSCIAIYCTSVFVLKTTSVAMKYLITYSILCSRWKQSCNEVVGYSCWNQRVLQWGSYNCMSTVFLFSCWKQRMLQWASYNCMFIVFLFSCWKQWGLQRSILMSFFVSQRCLWTAKQHGYTPVGSCVNHLLFSPRGGLGNQVGSSSDERACIVLIRGFQAADFAWLWLQTRNPCLGSDGELSRMSVCRHPAGWCWGFIPCGMRLIR